MTVPSTTSRDQQTGNGSTTVFTVPFRILNQAHIRVLLTVSGVTTELVLTTHYSVGGVGGANTTITFVTAPASGALITFLRNVPLTQDTDYVPNDPFPAESHEAALDKLTMIAQQLDEGLDRSLILPEQVSGVSTELPVPAANNLVGWNAAATALRNWTQAELTTSISYANKLYQTFTGDGAQVNFILSQDPGSLGNLEVSIDGVMQVPGLDFTYTLTTLTFTAPPANGATILVRYDIGLPTGVTDAAGVNYTPPSTGALGTVKSFLDALWSTGTNLGAKLIRWIQSGAGAIARTIEAKLRETVTITDYGAVGDGVTDNTAAIQAAHDALPATGGKIIVPNGGFWLVSGTVNITKPVTIEGQGLNNITNLKKNAADVATPFFTISASGVGIRDLCLSGPGKALAAADTYAVNHAAGSRFWMENVDIKEVFGGVKVKGNLFSIRNVEVRDFQPTTGIGILVDQSGLTDGVGEIVNCTLQNGSASESLTGVHLLNCTGIQIQSCDIMQTGVSMRVIGCHSINADNTFFDNSEQGGVSIEGGVASRRLRFSNCWFASAHSGAGFVLQNTAGTRAEGVIITGCEFYDSQRGIWLRDNALTDSFQITNCVFAGHTTADIDIGQNVGNWSVIGCRTGVVGSFAASPVGLTIGVGALQFLVADSWLHNLTDNSGAVVKKHITNISGGPLMGVRNFNPPSIASGASSSTTVTVSGCQMGDLVDVSYSLSLQGLGFTGYVSAAGTVTVVWTNLTGGAVDLATGDIIARCHRITA